MKKKLSLIILSISLIAYAATTNQQVDNANPLDLNDYDAIMGTGSDISNGDDITALTLNQKFTMIKTKLDDIVNNLQAQITDLQQQLANAPIDCTNPANIDEVDCQSIPNPVLVTQCSDLSTNTDFNGNSVQTYQDSSCYVNGDMSALGGCFVTIDELNCVDSCPNTSTDKKCDNVIVTQFAYIEGQTQNIFETGPYPARTFEEFHSSGVFVSPRIDFNPPLTTSNSTLSTVRSTKSVSYIAGDCGMTVFVNDSSGSSTPNGWATIYNNSEADGTGEGDPLSLSECQTVAAHLFGVSSGEVEYVSSNGNFRVREVIE